MADSDRRVELVGNRGAGQHEAARLGLGLIAGLVVGHRQLLAAATGRGAFEIALGSFVLIVLLCVGGALFLGGLYDRLARQTAEAQREDEDANTDDVYDDATEEMDDGSLGVSGG